MVRCAWEQESTGHVQRVLPDNCADILVTADGRAVLVGPPTQVELPRLATGVRIHGLRIEPYAIRTVFGLDADELTDRTLPLEAVLGDGVARRVAEAVWEGTDLPWQDVRPDEPTVGIVRALTGPGAPSVDAVADRAGYSPRHLRRLVRTETGLSPKTLQRVARLHEFLGRAEFAPVGAAAVAAGYADQPHATREIRALTGLTPRQLIAERAET
ncbi:helix-turn-helix domain-containing protein [Cryptosporangium sp. NPDC048952]|uniref:helix-turn-helix domain-containing protein n=1 Tax=Cryptosporangium sp. NPDC048952 TaxID=3363961 RepID=UPI003722853B